VTRTSDTGRGSSAGGRRPVARRPNDRYELALRAATEVIAERGVEQTRYRDVADASGIPIATLQYMFGTLEDLVLETLERGLQDYRAATRELLAGIPSAPARLKLFIERNVGDGSDTSRTQWRIWLEAWYRAINDPETRDRMSQNGREWQEMLHAILEDGRASGAFRADLDVDDVTVQIYGLLDGMGAALILQTEQADAQRVRRLGIDAALRIVR
jgi:AcrR family transcriptional regulator